MLIAVAGGFEPSSELQKEMGGLVVPVSDYRVNIVLLAKFNTRVVLSSRTNGRKDQVIAAAQHRTISPRGAALLLSLRFLFLPDPGLQGDFIIGISGLESYAEADWQYV
ncbi:hypothetical protein NUW58_g5335 [Xylaria curta]|uniref:Uncharacterized protein n=1 Tax=Xylaria curta TaxID=42375 RepID=A0ACC1P382_9PEZI|nr:hypothetical protein NUW58_g5335 [Xylaria curta]